MAFVGEHGVGKSPAAGANYVDTAHESGERLRLRSRRAVYCGTSLLEEGFLISEAYEA